MPTLQDHQAALERARAAGDENAVAEISGYISDAHRNALERATQAGDSEAVREIKGLLAAHEGGTFAPTPSGIGTGGKVEVPVANFTPSKNAPVMAPTPYGVGGGMGMQEQEATGTKPIDYAGSMAGYARMVALPAGIAASGAAGLAAIPAAAVAGGFGYMGERIAQLFEGQQKRELAFQQRKREITEQDKKDGVPAQETLNKLSRIDLESFNQAQAIKSGIVSAIPGVGPGSEALGSVRAISTIGKPVAAIVGGEALGETARRSFEQGKFNTYTSLGEAAKDLAPAAGIGLGFGAINQASLTAADRQARIDYFKANGISPTLEMMVPSLASTSEAARRAGYDPAWKQLLDSEQSLAENFSKLFPTKFVQSEEVRQAFVPYLNRIDTQRAIVKQASAETQAAEQAYARAGGDINASPESLASLRQEFMVKKANELNARAQQILDVQSAFGEAATRTHMADEVTNLVSDFNSLRKMRADELFKAAGVDGEAELFTVGDLVDAVKNGLRKNQSTDAAKKIVASVEALATKEGGDMTPVTLNQVRELRSKFSENFVNIPEDKVHIAESLASDAYSALLRATEEAIPQGQLKAYKDAVAYWASTSEAKSNYFGRALLRGEISDEAVGNLAENIAKGNLSQLRGFERYLNSVVTDSPEVAQIARQQFDGVLRNSVLSASSGPGTFGIVDTKRLVDILSRFPKEVPVENLGFGSREFIKSWADTFKKYDLNTLTPQELDKMFSNPAVRQAAITGASPSDVISPLAARAAFDRDVRMMYLERTAGIKAKSGDAAYLRKLAKEAGMKEGEAAAELARLERDPIMQEFAPPVIARTATGEPIYGRSETFGIKPSASEGSGEIINTIASMGDRGRKFLNTIKANDPEKYALLEGRYMSERTASWFIPDRTRPGQNWQIDKQAIVDFLNPKPGARDTVEGFAKDFLSPERYKELVNRAKAFMEIADIGKAGQSYSNKGVIETMRALSMGQSLAAGRGVTQATMAAMGASKIMDYINIGKWKAFNAMIGDTKFANAMWDTGGGVLKSLNDLGPSRANALLRKYPDLAEAASGEASGGGRTKRSQPTP